MKHSIDVNWSGNMAFKGNIDGHTILMDADPEVGGENKGPKPKPLMLLALAGCTGMDVISILKKMRLDVEDFNIKVDGELTEDFPKQYHSIHITYEFKGTDLPFDKLEKAVNLSQERYCGVYAVYMKAIKITSEIKIL